MSKLVQLNPTQKGPQYWRSLGELYHKPEFREWVDQEFAGGAAETLDKGSRRNVLKLMAASFGLAGLTACRRPEAKILPHSKGVEGFIPGKPEFYATQFTLSGVANGILVEAHDGRPTKVEGNDKHPTSLGAATALAQASVLNVYDPDRSKEVLEKGKSSNWKAFTDALKGIQFGDGTGFAILSEINNSKSLAAAKQSLLAKYPKAKWVEYEPINYANVSAGAALAFGPGVDAHPQFDKAKVIVSLDYDFLGIDAPNTIPTRQFAAGRRIGEHPESMNRLYVVEGQFSLTGAMADHRLRAKVAEVKSFAMQLGEALGVLPAGLNVLGNTDRKTKFLNALVKDLKANQGAALVVAGPRQPAVVHAIAHLINSTLAAPVVFTKGDAAAGADPVAAIKTLAEDMNKGAVSTLLILGGNPAFTAPSDLRFADAIGKVKTSIHLGADADETAKAATWHIPQAHALESWGDATALDGTVSIQQPLIEPIYGGKSALELLHLVAGNPAAKGHDLVKAYWLSVLTGDKESAWRTALHDGVVAGSAAAEIKPAVDANRVRAAAQAEPKPSGAGWEVSFYPSATCYDGRFANNGWMQECPDPMTKIIWGNAGLVSPKTARDKSLADNDVVKVTVGGQTLNIPVRIQPGMADNALWLNLGYGRKTVGRIGEGVGFNGYAVRTTAGFWFAEGAQVDAGACASAWCRVQTPDRSRRHARRIQEEPEVRGGDGGASAARIHLRKLELRQGLPVGHGDRPQRLHWLQCLYRRLPVGKQHSDRRQERSDAGPRNALDPHGPLLHGSGRRAASRHAAGQLHAVRKRAMRERLPGGRHDPLARGPQRHGVQPLRRNPLLREQLSVQGSPVQLPQLAQEHHGSGEDGPQSGCQRSHARCHGKVHLLRAAHFGSQDRSQGRRAQRGQGCGTEGRSDPDRVSTNLPGRRDRLWQHSRPRKQGVEAQEAGAQLRDARRTERPAAHDVFGQAP
jgi:MoCo/4Fe-4S cofactor protein with predicted Tat translocation signal